MPEQTTSENGTIIELPDFPRPDLPESAPENYPTLRLRVLRRLGLPEDGRAWLNDMMLPDVLSMYHGEVTEDDRHSGTISFASLLDAVSWADGITTTGHDREMIQLQPTSDLFGKATIKIRF